MTDLEWIEKVIEQTKKELVNLQNTVDENNYHHILNRCMKLDNSVTHLQQIKAKLEAWEEKETPKKFEIMDKDLIFHSTPQPTKYYVNIRCSCGEEFECRGYQHWKVIDKNNVEKDYFEYEYTYCPHCGKRLER